MKKVFSYEFNKLGRLWIAEEDCKLVKISFSEISGCEFKETEFIKEVKKQLDEYFSGKREKFNLPLAPSGTEFQKKVWNALTKIPYGKTCSYQDIACEIGNPNACRAVGMANNKNPIAIIIPCHRVVGKNGGLTGYAGGLGIKKVLLDIEKKDS